MLVAAVSIVGAALVMWSNTSFAMQQASIAEQTTGRINLINESFIIEDVWFFSNATGTYANVTILNTGDLAIRVSNIYINNTQTWNDGEDVLIGDFATIDVPTAWEADRPQSIWIKTERGAEAKQVWKS